MAENEKIYISGMECASCERLITKAVESAGGHVQSIDAKTGVAQIDYPDGALDRVKEAVIATGYGIGEKREEAAAEPFEQEFRIFLHKLFSGEKELWAERKIMVMSLLSLLLLATLGFFFYLFVWHSVASFAAKIPFLFYTGLSAVAIVASLSHYRSHKLEFTCMEGMMIGMTIGMMAGFLFGAIIGATNGMFVGSVFGMAVGMLTGAYAGKCCGIMGVMEGIMAGLMGGTMGAMLTVMLIADNLSLFMPILLASCLAILAGLTYMIYNSAGKRVERTLMPFGQFFLFCLLLSAISVAIMLFGPRGPITI